MGKIKRANRYEETKRKKRKEKKLANVQKERYNRVSEDKRAVEQ